MTSFVTCARISETRVLAAREPRSGGIDHIKRHWANPQPRCFWKFYQRTSKRTQSRAGQAVDESESSPIVEEPSMVMNLKAGILEKLVGHLAKFLKPKSQLCLEK
ncbi:uncharacterized protein isoform X3 [Castor canadensis]|uniref:Uncharacterized protein isoform X3 n=2 Tax=Castor canadensis TaxID=51338 RepID=A0AC58ML23_CASCN